MPKKKTSYVQRRQKDEPNKKLIIWISSIFGLIVIVMALLLILNP